MFSTQGEVVGKEGGGGFSSWCIDLWQSIFDVLFLFRTIRNSGAKVFWGARWEQRAGMQMIPERIIRSCWDEAAGGKFSLPKKKARYKTNHSP